MSCIQKILELKGNKEFLPVKINGHIGIIIESGGEYKGYHWLITFQDLGFRCGYVALPSNHKFNNLNNTDECDRFLDVHGGVTFFGENHLSNEIFQKNYCTDKWIGFDGGHYPRDAKDTETIKKYFSQLSNSVVLDYFNFLSYEGTIRTKEYMMKECQRLIDQLISYEAIDN